VNKTIQQIILLLFFIITGVSIASCDLGGSEESEWELIWQDEFEGPAGQKPDANKWVYDIGTDWGNAQLEYDTDRPENASLDGEGNLAITARKESYEGQNYTSARILTRGKFETTYGKIEASILLPWGQGIWPAFWMLGNDFNTVGWPACGEIDMMEYRGQEVTKISGTVHGPGYSGSSGIGSEYELVKDRFDTGFHTFTLEWGVDYLKWFVDGILFQTITPDDLPGKWVYDHPFYIILNVAVGGNYVGSPNQDTLFPQTMRVDYVRVYRAKQ
jgi:beta-glucanase (GH16 family)